MISISRWRQPQTSAVFHTNRMTHPHKVGPLRRLRSDEDSCRRESSALLDANKIRRLHRHRDSNSYPYMIQHRGSGLRFGPSAVGNGCQGTIGVKRTGRLSRPVMVERLYTSTPAGTAVSVTGQSPFTTGARRCPVAALTQKVAAIPARTFLLSRAEKSAEFVCARGVSTERPGTNFQRGAMIATESHKLGVAGLNPAPASNLARAVARNHPFRAFG